MKCRYRPRATPLIINRLPPLDVLAEAIVQGDAKVQAISAASILAKVTRDRLLDELHLQHPQYGFNQHKGYGTAQHLDALRQHGPLPVHRRSFAPVAQAFAERVSPARPPEGARTAAPCAKAAQ